MVQEFTQNIDVRFLREWEDGNTDNLRATISLTDGKITIEDDISQEDKSYYKRCVEYITYQGMSFEVSDSGGLVNDTQTLNIIKSYYSKSNYSDGTIGGLKRRLAILDDGAFCADILIDEKFVEGIIRDYNENNCDNIKPIQADKELLQRLIKHVDGGLMNAVIELIEHELTAIEENWEEFDSDSPTFSC
jgi:hypothetical protein